MASVPASKAAITSFLSDSSPPAISGISVYSRMILRIFGITPGTAEIWVTLRTQRDAAMAALKAEAQAIVRDAAARHDLQADFDWQDDFAASINDPEATAIALAAAEATGLDVTDANLPMRPSEDFGRFAARAKTAMIFLGAGTDHPPLHAQDYDFPDALIAPSVRLFDRIARDLTG